LERELSTIAPDRKKSVKKLQWIQSVALAPQIYLEESTAYLIAGFLGNVKEASETPHESLSGQGLPTELSTGRGESFDVASTRVGIARCNLKEQC
jgi:hypothetical protein